MLALYLELNGLLLERENLEEDNPGNEEEEDCERSHEGHPLSESDVHVHSHRVIEIFQCDSVRRGSDRGSDSSDVCRDRDCQRKGDLALSVCRQRLQHRGEECQHHCRGGCVAEEHREYGSNENESQEHESRLRSERLQEGLGQHKVQSALCGGDCKHESSDEKHDDRVCKAVENRFVAYRGAKFIRVISLVEEPEAAVGCSEQQEHDYHHRCGPGRNGFEHPHEDCEHEDGDRPLLDYRQSLNSEERSRQQPEYQWNDGRDCEPDGS